jgi:hypothetical protein
MKRDYRDACASGLPVPLFSQPWWLDAVAGGDGWDVALVTNGEGIVASMPYCVRRRYGLIVSAQPPLTQTLGPWLRGTGAGTAKALSRQKRLMDELIVQLPDAAFFSQNWHYSQQNWLPFYWKGFRQTTRYTYVLPDLTSLDRVWGGLDQSARTDIRKAGERFGVRLREAPQLLDLLALSRKTFERQGRRYPYREDIVQRLYATCLSRGAGQILIAEDAAGRAHAGAFIVWDQNSAYYLIGGGDPELRSSGATSYCLWEAIRSAARVTARFDFEGSMIEPIEKFFRSFGAEQVPYFNVSRTSSKFLALLDAVRGVWRAGK